MSTPCVCQPDSPWLQQVPNDQSATALTLAATIVIMVLLLSLAGDLILQRVSNWYALYLLRTFGPAQVPPHHARHLG